MAQKTVFKTHDEAVKFIDQFAFRGQTRRHRERQRRIRVMLEAAPRAVPRLPAQPNVEIKRCMDCAESLSNTIHETLKCQKCQAAQEALVGADETDPWNRAYWQSR